MARRELSVSNILTTALIAAITVAVMAKTGILQKL
jgi:hypothetical protein